MLKKFFEKTGQVPTVARKDPDYKTPLPNFKGQRKDPNNLVGSLPASKTTTESRYRTGPIHNLHPREIRAKSWLSMSLYAIWYLGIFTFISYRLSSEDLDTLEKEARAEIDIKKKIQKEFIN